MSEHGAGETTVVSGDPEDRGRRAVTRVEPARVFGSEPPVGFAPTGPSAERDFFAERLALFARIATIASAGFLIMRVALDAFSRRRGVGPPWECGHADAVALAGILVAPWLDPAVKTCSTLDQRMLGGLAPRGATASYG